MSGPRLGRMGCPECGALLGPEAAHGAVRCDYCGRRSAAVDSSVVVPRLWFEPRTDRSEALLALRRGLLAEDVLPASLRGELQPVEARLVFVPFHWVRALRVGVVERQHDAREITVTEMTPDARVILRTKKVGSARSEDRAKVVVADVERSAPAVRRRDWGLERLSPGALLAAGFEPQPFDGDRVGAHGTVLLADVEPAAALELIPAGGAADRVERIAPSVREVLLPVWRIRYRVRGCLYDASVDAVEGRLLAARAPEDDRRRVPLALAYLGAGSASVGILLRVFGDLGAGAAAEVGDLVGWILLPAVVVLGLFGAYAWNLVRYDVDRFYDGASVEPRYLNRPQTATGGSEWGDGLDRTVRRAGNVLTGGDLG